MRGDFSRLSFDHGRYSRVLMQQGRVLLDADWNEQSDLFLHYVRGVAADLIGPHGGPEGTLGFKTEAATVGGRADVAIGAGRYYVDGLVCELAPAPDTTQPASTYLSQPYLPRVQSDPAIPATTPYLVYLDVWEQHITALDEDDIREVALGGPDTASRARIVWQVKILHPIAPFTEPQLVCATFPLADFRRHLTGVRPRLKARTRPFPRDAGDDPCIAPADARYRGAENQLYRVEIHEVADEGGVPVVTFKWSRENGSVAAAWLETRRNDVVVGGVRDRVRGFEVQQLVELTDDRRELRAEPGLIVPITAIRNNALTLDPGQATIESNPSQLLNAKVRRWDHGRTSPDELRKGAVKVRFPATDDDAWIDLEQGIQVQFQAAGADPVSYRTGDYWLIPARTATGDVIWPRETDGRARALPPHGVEHHYAPLALVGPNPVRDLRRVFMPLAACV
jgi:hypothetical protein